jgi:hypothetical protein
MKKVTLAILFTLIASFLMVFIVRAQDETATIAPEPTAEVTEVVPDGDGDTTIIVEPAPTVIDVSSLWGLLAGLAVVFAGGGSLLVILNNSLKSKQVADNTEKLYEGLSPTWQDSIHRVIDTADNAIRVAEKMIDFAKRVTDGLPNQEVVEESKVFTNTPRP